jgi:ketosteroid isomerase-like protein
MSRENVELLMRAFTQAPDDPEPFFALLDENVEWDMTEGPYPDRITVYGQAAVREFFRTWAGTFDDWGYEAEEVIDAGPLVFLCLRQWGRGKGSGVPVDNRIFTVWTFQDRKVIRYKGFTDRAQALEHAGLPRQ